MRMLAALLSCAAIGCGARVDDPQDYPGGLGVASGASSGSSGSSGSGSSGGPTISHPHPNGVDGGTPGAPDGGPVTRSVITPGPGTTITFAPSLVEATRFPVTCGVMNPPFESGDAYFIDIVGQKMAGPENAITISFTSPAPPLDTPIALAVQPYVAMANGNGTSWLGAQSASGAGFAFQFSQGSHANEIDAGAFDSVVVTLLAMPSTDGQPLTFRIQMHFVDGQTLDYTFAPALTSSWSGCPSG